MTCKDCAVAFPRKHENGRPPLRCPECAAVAAGYASRAGHARWMAKQDPDVVREAGRIKQAARRRRDPEAYALYRATWRHTGIAPGGFGTCPICSREAKLVVDHDHACCPSKDKSCGQCFRGHICGSCNSMLGYAGDSLATLSAAGAYLRATINLR